MVGMRVNDLFRQPEWQQFSICKGMPSDWFFPVYGQGIVPKVRIRKEKNAKNVCALCPVRVSCREVAMLDPDAQGIWGGTTEAERRTLRKRRRLEQLHNEN